ncbi:hypothetical protein [Nocardioides jishulii]|uniref:Uncharacterized protein n=1 Tax=Nocardioides jishulii TaxID=2575440 RepID=A0A4U2YKY2_9ACTN|nr:hypothetical protein [Nocardioides jishulii]QCX26951.1 hypothetical protein FCL41_04955 [Nocardioides jishulii]TKI61434.1 hypothetical protein FC770_11590 [Nocardioides jishulii]
MEPVIKDDGSSEPPPTFTPDLHWQDVEQIADAGDDFEDGEQFALAAMQFALDSENATLDQKKLNALFASEEARQFLAHANESVAEGGIKQRWLTDHPGWVRSQWISEGDRTLRTQLLARHLFQQGVATELWADTRVEVVHTGGRWRITSFMFVPGPTDEVLSDMDKEILMGDESTWRQLEAIS